MNIIQLHERIRFWVDVVSSTRFESEDIDNALNVTIDNKVRESYDQNRPMNRSDAFQRVQRVRDELGPLVKILGVDDGSNDSELYISGTYNIRIANERYGYLLALRISLVSGGWHPTYPITYDRKNIISRNPFRRVRMIPQSKIYYNEHGGTVMIGDPQSYIKLELPDGEVMSNFELSFLMTPLIVNYGIEYTSSKTFSNSDIVIAIEETIYAGTTYVIGQKFTIVTPNLNITSGAVVHAFVECDVRSTTHEEIARRAAINCLLTAGENEKVKALREEIVAS